MTVIEPAIHLLMVDDEEEFTSITSRLLERRGVRVTVASSGEQALELLPEVRPNVVLLDIKMPGMDGEEVFDRIRLKYPDLPVIVLTGHGAIPQAFRMSKQNVFDYLPKPCGIDELLDKLKAAVHSIEPHPEEISQVASADIKDVPCVLLVDDEEELLDSLSTVIRRRGMKVYTAGDGASALALLNDSWVDVVVLDIKLPGMDGLDVLRRMKAIRPDVEVILLTGHPNVSNAMDGIKLGAMEYIVKPPEMRVLLKTIQQAFVRRRETFEKRQHETIRDVLNRGPVD